MNLLTFTSELLADEAFKKASTSTIGYELDQEYSQRHRMCDYSLDELDPSDITVAFDPVAYIITIDHKNITVLIQIANDKRILFNQ